MQSVVKYLISKYLLMQHYCNRPICIVQITDNYALKLFYSNIDFQEVTRVKYANALSSSPQTTLIISVLSFKYPKKYPKRAFSGSSRNGGAYVKMG